MTPTSTTIRVSIEQRERALAEQRASTMADTLSDALEALRRNEFYSEMARAEAATACGHWRMGAVQRRARRVAEHRRGSRMNFGDVVMVDFGIPLGSETGF